MSRGRRVRDRSRGTIPPALLRRSTASGLVAHVSPAAFVVLAASAVEVYKRECLGLLLGRRRGSRFVVEHAVTYQQAERRHHGVAVHEKIERRVLSVLERLPGAQLLGDFHSHPQFGCARGLESPSCDDQEGLAPGQISMIVAVNDAARARPFREHDDGTISGVIGRFDLRLGAFALHRADEVAPVALRCPYALEL